MLGSGLGLGQRVCGQWRVGGRIGEHEARVWMRGGHGRGARGRRRSTREAQYLDHAREVFGVVEGQDAAHDVGHIENVDLVVSNQVFQTFLGASCEEKRRHLRTATKE